ncbi:MAG TPA: CsbD family protein [Bosea sp. (in: a-proteobacteria)]|nr:CsbD family protein [Bosea sp. (in: a-proteobacteria)]
MHPRISGSFPLILGGLHDRSRQAAGNVKQAAGKAMDKPRLHAEGVAQERKGEVQQALGKGKDAVKKVVDKA